MPLPAAALAAIPAVGSLLGGVLGNRGRSKEAAKDRQFQERMRNTSWQAGVADMEAAGINPALAYQQGGAAQPGGAQAGQEDVISPSVTSAQQARRLGADLDAIRAGIRKTGAEEGLLGEQKRKAKIEADRLELQGPIIDRAMDGINSVMDPQNWAGAVGGLRRGVSTARDVGRGLGWKVSESVLGRVMKASWARYNAIRTAPGRAVGAIRGFIGRRTGGNN